ncbi:MAG TPA: response regulator, partial [Deferrisomatales bacterium]|nr:response regulator [Deferrisomatales bacterium]
PFPKPRAMTEPTAPNRDISILVIDDDPGICSILAEYLADEGYTVSAEGSGEAGLTAFQRQACDLVLTDLRMPGLDGMEVLRRVKETSPRTEVIVITGYATIQDGVDAMRHGAYDFLLKPVKIPQLDAVLNRCCEWIRHRRSHAELEAVNRELLELNRMKQRFLAVTDHELRTPVTVLDGMLQLLVRQSGDLPEAVRSRLTSLRQVSQRLSSLVQDIRDVVRSRDQSLEVVPDDTTVAVLVRGVELDFEMVRFSRALDLVLNTGLEPSLIFRADAHRLRQAVTELIQNAVKATADGGRVEVALAVEARDPGPCLCVTVADTGTGIPPDQRQRIFEACHGLGHELRHHTSKFEYQGAGLGLGLSIAQEIARAHGGGLELESEPGLGSTFTVWVPLQ